MSKSPQIGDNFFNHYTIVVYLESFIFEDSIGISAINILCLLTNDL